MGPQNSYGLYGGTDFQYQTPQKQPLLKTRRGKLLVVGGVMFLLVAILGALAGVSSSGNKNKAEKLMSLAFKDGNADSSYVLLNEDLQLRTNKDTWGANIKSYKEQYTSYALDAQTSSTKEDGTTDYYYTYSLTPKNDESKYTSWVNITMRKSLETKKDEIIAFRVGTLPK